MSTDHPLTLTVEQAGQVLGVGRSTAYELVRSGDLKCIRLRRRIVVPVAHLAESLGVDRDTVWATLTDLELESTSPSTVVASTSTMARRRRWRASETPTLFWHQGPPTGYPAGCPKGNLSMCARQTCWFSVTRVTPADALPGRPRGPSHIPYGRIVTWSARGDVRATLVLT